MPWNFTIPLASVFCIGMALGSGKRPFGKEVGPSVSNFIEADTRAWLRGFAASDITWNLKPKTWSVRFEKKNFFHICGLVLNFYFYYLGWKINYFDFSAYIISSLLIFQLEYFCSLNNAIVVDFYHTIIKK